MPVDNLSLKIISNRLQEEMSDSSLGKPFFLGNNSYAIPYNRDLDDGSFIHGTFIFSLEPSNPYVCYSKERFEKLEDNSPFYNSLKKLCGCKVEKIEKYQGERIITIDLKCQDNNIEQIYDSYSLVLELFPNRCNCYIIAHPLDKIITVYKEHIDIEKNIFITRNVPYIYPERRDDIPYDLKEGEDARPYLPNATLKYLKTDISKGKEIDSILKEMKESKDIYIIGKDVLSYHFDDIKAVKVDVSSIYTHFVKDQKDVARLDKNKELLSILEKALKSAKKKEKNIKNDLETAKKNMVFIEYGQKIYQYQDQIKKGDEILEVEEYKIPLDKKKNIQQNAAYYFKRYSKAKSAQVILKDILKKCEDEIFYLEKKNIEARDGTPRDIMELKSELLEQGYIKAKPGRNTIYKVNKKHRYEPHYIKGDDYLIGFGMNGLQNETLTFDIAKKDDLFLHVKDHPGSHVLILDGESDKSFLIACELALYLSHLKDGDVMYSERKNVKKNPNSIGLVNILKYETAHISSIRSSSKAVFDKELKKKS